VVLKIPAKRHRQLSEPLPCPGLWSWLSWDADGDVGWVHSSF
jgi:hypothetical protein